MHSFCYQDLLIKIIFCKYCYLDQVLSSFSNEFLNGDKFQLVDIDINTCSYNDPIVLTHLNANVFGFTNIHNFNRHFNACMIKIQVPKMFNIVAYARFDLNYTRFENCQTTTVIRMNDKGLFSYYVNRNDKGHRPSYTFEKAVMLCSQSLLYNLTLSADHIYKSSRAKSPLVISKTNELYVLIEDVSIPANFWLYYKSVKLDMTIDWMDRINIWQNINNSSLSGKIMSLGYALNLEYPDGIVYNYHFNPPLRHNYMISFPDVQLYLRHRIKSDEIVIWRTKSKRTVARHQGIGELKSEIFAEEFTVSFTTSVIVPKWRKLFSRGFKILYSLHSQNKSIVQLPWSKFDCSRHYNYFRHHLECNVRAECDGGEDEPASCPYTCSQCQPEELCVQVNRKDGGQKKKYIFNL